MIRSLEKLGCEVDIAMNGLEALEKWEHRAYDLVLMDCQMPEMDGYEAAIQIRNREHGRGRTPIVAVTANAMTYDRERCRQTGMDGFLSKPIHMEELKRLLAQHLGEPQATPTGR